MSFGRPPQALSGSPLPPQKGSFPLDHYAECKEAMTEYLTCLKQHKGRETDCRQLAKKYMKCRMDKGLFERDEWRMLGFQDEPNETPPG